MYFFLADDHSIVRHGIEIVIHECVPNAIVHHTSALHQVEELIKTKGVEILVIDAHFPDGNSLHILPQLKDANPDLKSSDFSGLEENLHLLNLYMQVLMDILVNSVKKLEVEEAIRSIVQRANISPKFPETYWFSMPIIPGSVNPLSNLTKKENYKLQKCMQKDMVIWKLPINLI